MLKKLLFFRDKSKFLPQKAYWVSLRETHVLLRSQIWFQKNVLIFQSATYIVLENTPFTSNNALNHIKKLLLLRKRGMFLTQKAYWTFLREIHVLLRSKIHFQKNLVIFQNTASRVYESTSFASKNAVSSLKKLLLFKEEKCASFMKHYKGVHNNRIMKMFRIFTLKA